MAKVVVLDVDGTLMDTNYLHTEAWALALAEVGRHAPMSRIHKQIGKGSDQLVKEFVEDEETSRRITELHGEFYSQMQHRGYPLPGARDLISSLHERGYEVWFATSAKPEELELHHEKLESKDKISGVVSSGDVENSKPAPDIFELALEKAGSSAEETVALGDSIWDVESAKAAGISTVAVLTGGAFGASELTEAGAVEVYEDCAAFLESGYLENLGKNE